LISFCGLYLERLIFELYFLSCASHHGHIYIVRPSTLTKPSLKKFIESVIHLFCMATGLPSSFPKNGTVSWRLLTREVEKIVMASSSIAGAIYARGWSTRLWSISLPKAGKRRENMLQPQMQVVCRGKRYVDSSLVRR